MESLTRPIIRSQTTASPNGRHRQISKTAVMERSGNTSTGVFDASASFIGGFSAGTAFCSTSTTRWAILSNTFSRASHFIEFES